MNTVDMFICLYSVASKGPIWKPNQFHGYSYVAIPDDDGRVHVAMPPPEYGGAASLTVLAEDHLPAVAGVIESDTFWEQVEEEGGEPFLSFNVDLKEGEIGPPDGNGDGFNLGWLMAGGGGALVLAALASAVVINRARGRL